MHLSRLRVKSKRDAGIKHNFTLPHGDVIGDFIGLKGEYAVAHYFGVPMDDSIGTQGDGGVDLIIGTTKIEVKTASRPNGRIIHRPHRNNKKYDILIFCTTGQQNNIIKIVGWCDYPTFKQNSYRADLGYGMREVMNQGRLRPMSELSIEQNPSLLKGRLEEQINAWSEKISSQKSRSA